jgi:hypothetical protein
MILEAVGLKAFQGNACWHEYCIPKNSAVDTSNFEPKLPEWWLG